MQLLGVIAQASIAGLDVTKLAFDHSEWGWALAQPVRAAEMRCEAVGSTCVRQGRRSNDISESTRGGARGY